MHEITLTHHHELTEEDFYECCRDCQDSVSIIKPRIIDFAYKIKAYSHKELSGMDLERLYGTYQLLDDLAHLQTGYYLAELILREPEINRWLPTIRSYYTLFFSIHELQLARDILASKNPWGVVTSFPLYNRYDTLIKNQMAAMSLTDNSKLAFIGCGSVPMSIILMSGKYNLTCVGIDCSPTAVELASKVIDHLGLSRSVSVLHGNESLLRSIDWNIVLVAALAEPKKLIFENIKNLIREREDQPLVIFRTYTGMKRVLYDSVKDTDIKGYKIINEIYPVDRVNNTTVFAKVIC
ncbi:MAG: nicotianamine synthase [Desulfobulbaceae bacterium]|nr:nicotianamine synthase [Desulfobulbaceae bacterium]